jgi:hypothetical protein
MDKLKKRLGDRITFPGLPVVEEPKQVNPEFVTKSPEELAALEQAAINRENAIAAARKIAQQASTQDPGYIDPRIGLPNTEVDPTQPEVYSAVEPTRFNKIKSRIR